jgi:hypothetical protein
MSFKQKYKYNFARFAQSSACFAVKKNPLIVKIYLILIIPFISGEVKCQETKLSESIINIAEDLAASEQEPEAAAAYTDRLYELAEDPVNLNSSDVKEISRLLFLTDFQAKALADYTHSSGRIISFNELAYIPGFDRATAEMMIPFCTIKGKEFPLNDSSRLRNSFLTNLSVRSGKPDTTSLGSAWRILARYKFTAGSFSGGLSVEKDPGEKFFCPGTIGPDFLSANIAYNGKGAVRRIILGDYSVRFGQGLNINTGISTGLSLTSQGYMSATNEIKPYGSTDENNFFRGMATVLSYKNIELSLLYSKNNIDATLGTSSDNSINYMESLYKSGIHNTPSLLLKKDAVSESVIGINLSYNFSCVRVGMTWSETLFTLEVKPDHNNPEKIFSFSGYENNTFSVYYNSMIKNILLYGELSANETKRHAIVQGLSFRPSDRMVINFLFWKYKPGYTSFSGKGPGGSSGNYAEQSLLGNFTFEAARHLFISGGCCIQHFPWLRYRCSSPSWGVRREIRIKFMPSDILAFDWLYSYRLSMADNSNANRIPELKQVTSRNLKFVTRYSPYDNVTLGTRLDYKLIDPSGSEGIALLQELKIRLSSIPVTFWLRYCIFKTKDYDSRIYTWENDLQYTYSIPSLYGSGSRFYLMAGWKISGRAELRFKYGIFSKNDIPGEFTDTEEFRIQFKIII